MPSPDSTRLISIVVPAFNEERLLGAALKSIKEAACAFDQLSWNYELIVCDNNSTDRTAEVAAAAGATVIFEAVNQIGRARNRGAAVAKGDWLLFVDADSHPTPELFHDVAEAIKSGRCIAGGVILKMETPHRLARCVVEFWNWISRTFGLLAGSFIFCETAAFRDLGGFDETLFASEEIELSKRLKRAARRKGKKLIILRAHPMLTSSRKVRLYSIREHLDVIFKAIITGRGSLKDKRHCSTWYDGRR